MAEPRDYVKELKTAAKALERARAKEAEAWATAQGLMKEAHAASQGRLTFQQIADIFHVTKARVYQIATGKRGGVKAGKAA